MTTRSVLVLLATAAATGVWYIAACAWFPLAACRRCKGEGKFRSKTGRAWRLCKRCKGTGSRIRPGRIIWDRMHTTHGKAKKAA